MDATEDKHIQTTKPISERRIAYFLLSVVVRFYRDTYNHMYITRGMNLTGKVDRGLAGGRGGRKRKPRRWRGEEE